MKFIVGKKLDMTQVWQGDKVVAVTRVQAGPCVVAQVKTDDKDGYSSVQVGYGERKEKNIAKPQLGHLKKLEARNTKTQKHKNTKINLRYLREFRCGGYLVKKLKIEDVIDVDSFEVGDEIQVTGISKGKGFQGVVKRHGFHGQDKTHGTKDQLRMPGSIGATGPAHVFKGQKMPGRMGGDQVTVKGLEVVEVDKENNILLVKGAVPGHRNSLVLISGEGELKVRSEKESADAKAWAGKEVRSEETIDDRPADASVDTKVLADKEAMAGKQQTADEKVESTETQKSSSVETTEDKHEDKEVEKDEDIEPYSAEATEDENIEKVVVEAAEKQEKQAKREDKK